MVWDEVTRGVKAREGEPWRLTYNKISRMLPFKQSDSQRKQTLGSVLTEGNCRAFLRVGTPTEIGTPANGGQSHGPKRCLYSPETMKAFTISALTKLPLNWLSLFSQKL
jgi:hypothetical protein